MRWNVKLSKKPFFASEANEADVFGARLTSSVIVKLPQLVATVAVHVLLGSSFSFGFGRFPSGFGAGWSTVWQPLVGWVDVVVVSVVAAVVAGLAADAFLSFESPQPASRLTASSSVAIVL